AISFLKLLMPFARSPIRPEILPAPNRSTSTRMTRSQCQTLPKPMKISLPPASRFCNALWQQSAGARKPLASRAQERLFHAIEAVAVLLEHQHRTFVDGNADFAANLWRVDFPHAGEERRVEPLHCHLNQRPLAEEAEVEDACRNAFARDKQADAALAHADDGVLAVGEVAGGESAEHRPGAAVL